MMLQNCRCCCLHTTVAFGHFLLRCSGMRQHSGENTRKGAANETKTYISTAKSITGSAAEIMGITAASASAKKRKIYEQVRVVGVRLVL